MGEAKNGLFLYKNCIMDKLLIRVALCIILLSHSIPSIVTNSVYEFGKLYLDNQGFTPFGVLLAWCIKISHILTAIMLLWNKFIQPFILVTVFILLMGIVMIHFNEGWFVVGGGRNGMEYNFLLICVLLSLLVDNRNKKQTD